MAENQTDTSSTGAERMELWKENIINVKSVGSLSQKKKELPALTAHGSAIMIIAEH